MSVHHTHSTPAVRRRRIVALLASLGLLAAACGSEESAGEVVEPVDTSTTTEAPGDVDVPERTVVTAGGGETGEAPTTEAAAGTTETTEANDDAAEDDEEAADGEWPGEPLDFGPPTGTGLAVVGVAYDDELNFRSGPSPDADILASHAPLSDDLDMSSLGEAWAAPSGVWWKVNVAGTEAWANQAFLGSLGSPVDVFDQISAELGVLMFDSVEDAALAVADLRVSEDPESTVVFAAEALAFEVGGFAVVDVIGLGDDSVKGERIRIDVEIVFDEESGEEGAQDVAFFVLSGVEISPICSRGASGGLCV